MRCAPLLSPRTIQAQPNPLTMASVRSGSRAAVQASAASMLARSVRAKDRCSAWRSLRTPCVDDPAAAANHAACASSARSVSPASVIASSAKARMLSSSRYRGTEPSPSSTMTSERLARRPTTSIAVDGGTSSACEDGLDRRKGRAAGERGQRPQAPLVVGEQELVAPPDRRPECSASLRLAAGRVAQHAEAIVEATADLLDGQRLGARRGKLDREWQAVERPAQVVHLAHGAGPSGATGEQLHGVGERERRELEHDLAVDVECDLARAEDPERGGRVEEALRQRRGRGDDVLAVVEDDHRAGAPEPLEQRRLAAGDVQRGDHRVEDVVRRLRGLEPGQPDAAGHAGQRAPGRDGDRRLPDAPGPDDLDEPLAAEQLGEDGDLARRVRRARTRATAGSRPRGAIGKAESRVVVEDLSLELLQPRSRLEAELVGEPGADPLVRGERVGLAARPVERGDQQLPQPLLVGVGRDGGLQLADHGVAELQPGGRARSR